MCRRVKHPAPILTSLGDARTASELRFERRGTGDDPWLRAWLERRRGGVPMWSWTSTGGRACCCALFSAGTGLRGEVRGCSRAVDGVRTMFSEPSNNASHLFLSHTARRVCLAGEERNRITIGNDLERRS